MLVLTQFLLRLSFGMSAAMLAVSPRLVTSGYYRNNLYVVLGLNVLAALVAFGRDDLPRWPPVAGAAIAYLGAVSWLYEKPRAGMTALAGVAGTSLVGAWLALPWPSEPSALRWTLTAFDPATGGLLLGVAMASMLLGHWYLNSPGMRISPLMRLLLLLGVATGLRAIVCAAGLAADVSSAGWPNQTALLFLSLRWLGGIVGTAALAYMAFQTLKIPNTQSATGILYVAVLSTFLGELMSLLLSAESGFPL